MKKLQYILLVLVLVLASCNNKDSIWNVMGDLDSRVSTLETLCQEMNTNIAALETLIKAQNNGDYITNVTEIRNGNTIVGYTITFNHHDPITIYNGTNGKDGRDGVDGYKPTVGAKQDTDGVYYWTVDGNWLTDANGNKIRVTGEKGDKGDKGDTGDKGQDGQNGTDGTDGTNGVNGNTPQLKIENNYWYISYDGTNWTQLGKATGADGKNGRDGKDGKDGTNGAKGDKGEKGDKGDKGDAGDTIFRSVTQDDNYVYFTLADGTLIKLPKNGNGSGTGDQANSEFMFEVTFDANGGVGTMPKDTFYYGVSKQLTYCKFTNGDLNFTHWNTRPDGKGASYPNGMDLMINKNMTLYAQWTTESVSLSGVFSVSDTQEVLFSKGNLQYQPSTDRWRFAGHQYDYIGKDNENVSINYTGWIDLFCWGTGDTPLQKIIPHEKDFVDWGINTIDSDSPDTWRTLTGDEYLYILLKRPNAAKLWGLATIQGIKGIVILPDNWIVPTGVTFRPTSEEEGMKSTNTGWSGEIKTDYTTYNAYGLGTWKKMETAGAIFLPFAGRDYQGYDSENDNAYYWTASKQSNNKFKFQATSGNVSIGSWDETLSRYSVRLVKNLY